MPRCFQRSMYAATAAILLLAIINNVHGKLGDDPVIDTEDAPARLCVRLHSQVKTPFTMHIAADEDGEDDDPMNDDPSKPCSKSSNACYALWVVDYSVNATGVVSFKSQGCWETSGKEGCARNYCAADRKPPKAAADTKFCCCQGDFCNANVTDMYIPENDPGLTPPIVDKPYPGRLTSQYQTTMLIGGAVFLLIAFVAVALTVYRLWLSGVVGSKPAPDHLAHLAEQGGGPTESYSVEHLKLQAVVGQGRYGSVWKGHVRDQDVAVKIFPSHYRNYFLNERDIYCLPFMENPALLTYFGCDERVATDGSAEFLLVLSYAPNGCVQDYLRNNTVDCATFCRMAQSVARGLAHLHTDLKKGDKSKPCVSHRDLNTRNILVKNDLTCCLCDLGFAMKISGSKYYYNGEEQHAETKSINDVGTLRYMAPEVLEGAVNLRDCESSLKQIDVYALGLVLWELASRCVDFYQGGVQQTPSYALPFEVEVGHHPTFEQMQVLVSRHKARPLFSDLWKEWTAVKLLRETIEDCWDQDAEARLTALCVEERLQELPALWERKRATMYVSGMSPTVNSTQPLTVARTMVTENRLIESEDTAGSLNKEMQDSTASEGTVETMLTLSPTEPNNEPMYKITNHTIGGTYRVPMQQPYQGRNPCLERNLLAGDLSTGHLVDRSFKHTTSHAHSHYNAAPLESPLLAVQQTQQQRPATPIPYVQNVCENTYVTMPKQPNIPGNGRSNARWNWSTGLKKLFDRRRFFGRDRDESRCEDEAKSNLLARSPVAVETQVCLPQGKTVTVTSVAEESKVRRPSTLPLVAAQIELRASRQSLDDEFFSNRSVTSRHLKETNSRVKTPGDVVPGRGKRAAARFSLYDDRMMTSAVAGEETEVKVGLVMAPEKDSSSF